MQFRGNLPLLSNIADANYHALHRPKTAVDAHVGAWWVGCSTTPYACPSSAWRVLSLCRHIRPSSLYYTGKTLQEIADALGYKSKTSVMKLLREEE